MDNVESTNSTAVSKKRPIIGPIILILLGLIFLIDNMGIQLPWNYIWPILIIVIGLLLIINRTLISGGIITLLIIVVVIATIFSLVDSNIAEDLGIEIEKLSSENLDTSTKYLNIKKDKYENLKEIDLMVDIGVGEYKITSDKNSDNVFISKGIYNYATFEPILLESFTNNKLSIDYTTKDVISIFGFSHPISEYELNIGSPEVKTNFNLNIGTGKANLELVDQQIGLMDLKVGTGEMVVAITGNNKQKATSNVQIGTGKLNMNGILNSNITYMDAKVGTGQLNLYYNGENISDNYELDLDLGTGSVFIELPESVGYKIDTKVGTGKIKVNDESIDQENDYESRNYGYAKAKILFNLNIGTGQVKINEIK